MPLDKLNTKQRAYVEGRASGKNKKQAALDAGYSASTARVPGPAIEGCAAVRQEFRRLIRSKITGEKIAQRLAEGLDAVDTKFFQFEGEVTDSRDVVAWSERREYAKLAAEFGGYHVQKQEVTGDDDGPIVFKLERIG